MPKAKPRPGIYPREAPRATSSHGKAAVYEALRRQLPEGWYCWHSFGVFPQDQQEAEADFVIGIPERGMLVLEVKGGNIELRDGRWLQNGQAMDRRPLDQAHRAANAIRKRLEGAHTSYPAFGHAVVFPESAFSSRGAR